MRRELLVPIILILILQKGLAINPMKEYKLRPEKFDIVYEEKKILTADKYEITTWIMRSGVAAEKKKNCTLIISGSDAGNMGYSLPYAYYLLNEGYDVITYDYRGFGSSTSFNHNEHNLYHREYIEDFVTVVNWAKKNLSAEKIGVLSFSMGTLISSAGYERAKYDFLIGEGFIKSPRENKNRIKSQKGKRLKLPKGARKDGRQINKIEIPILIFASETDEITTLSDSEEIVSQQKNRTLIAYDGDHLKGGLTLGMEKYTEKIIKMIEKTTAN